MVAYVAPNYELESFNCPWCSAFAHQENQHILVRLEAKAPKEIADMELTQCAACENYAVWRISEAVATLAFPCASVAPQPIDGTPATILGVYNEARDVFAGSPRAAAALLRLALEVLFKELKIPGKDVNEQIATLVKQGLPEKIQKSMDILRVIGNNAVHPGTIDINDNQDMALHLFDLLNICVDALIVQPKRIEDLYSSLPESAKQQIVKRDESRG